MRLSNCFPPDSGPALFPSLTKENQAIVLKLIRLLLSSPDFSARFQALQAEWGGYVPKDEVIAFMDRWTGANSSSQEKEAV